MVCLMKTSREPKLTRNEALRCTPVKNRHAREQRLESGEIIIHYPLAVRTWLGVLGRWLKMGGGSPRTAKLQLDLLGAAVWGMLDGKRPLHRIAQAFAAEHQLEPKEAEIAVAQFIRELGRRGLIALH
jgi:Coenzyme PQQ synthesis protein D (PqqD)